MSKASPALGELIEAAQPLLSIRTPTRIQDSIDKIEREATTRGLGRAPWLTIVTATTVTRGSPESIAAVSQHVLGKVAPSDAVETMEFMREVGMNCMVMNGVGFSKIMVHGTKLI